MWLCGYVAMWLCSYVAMWLRGHVAMWPCGQVATWQCGYVAVWLRGHVARKFRSVLLERITNANKMVAGWNLDKVCGAQKQGLDISVPLETMKLDFPTFGRWNRPSPKKVVGCRGGSRYVEWLLNIIFG